MAWTSRRSSFETQPSRAAPQDEELGHSTRKTSLPNLNGEPLSPHPEERSEGPRLEGRTSARPSLPSPALTVIACGALARELRAVIEANGLGVKLACLPAHLHNRPQLIAEAVRRKIRQLRRPAGKIFVAYGDCGTGGALDAVLAEEGVERLPGAHCYAFYAGLDAFDAMQEAEPGTFYLTDFLARHFDRLIVRGLGLDRHPELFDDYFCHYRRVVFLAQQPSEVLLARARAAAAFLKLPLEVRETGFGLLGRELLRQTA